MNARLAIAYIVVLVLFAVPACVRADEAESIYDTPPWERTPEAAGYSVDAWEFGILLVPLDVELDRTEARELLVEVVEFCCRFWGFPTPVPPESWSKPFERGVCTGGPYGFGSVGTIGWGLPAFGLDWYPCWIEWGEEWIVPLPVVVYPTREALERAVGLWEGIAYFGWVPVSEEYWLDMFYGGIAIAAEDFNAGNGVLVHEVMHWLGAQLGTRHLAFNEGMSRAVEAAWVESDVYQRVSAAYASTGNLSELPRPLIYDVGASFTSYVWEHRFDRIDVIWNRTCDGASRHCEVWTDLVETYEEPWRESLSSIDPSEADWAKLEAKLQQLAVVERMLEPVINPSAAEIVTRVYAGDGTEGDIERFWELVCEPPDQPSDDAWESLRKREATLVQVAVRSALYEAPEPPDKVPFAGMDVPHPEVLDPLLEELATFRELTDWCGYYTLYLDLVREIIAEGTVYPDLIPWWSPESDDAGAAMTEIGSVN